MRFRLSPHASTIQTPRELQDPGNLLRARRAGPLLPLGKGTRGSPAPPSLPSCDTNTCLRTPKRKPQLGLTRVLDQSKRTGRIYDREPLGSFPAARDGKVRRIFDLCEEVPSSAPSPPAAAARRAPRGAGAAAASAREQKSPRPAGRAQRGPAGLLRTAGTAYLCPRQRLNEKKLSIHMHTHLLLIHFRSLITDSK